MKRIALIGALFFVLEAQAAVVTWTDWQSVSNWDGTTQTAYGQLVSGGDVVDITMTSTSQFYN